jgi:glycosyltransferase involved in cell wall biosynthesis
VNILLIAQEAALDPGEVSSGNAIRMLQLISALQLAGHAVTRIWLASPRQQPGSTQGSFHNRDELQGLIQSHSPDVILLAYWELAALLPFDLEQPVVVDLVAPRPLETLYESPERAGADLRRLRNALRSCDLVLVGNEVQRHLLILTLIEAGFDLRAGVPVAVVPLGAEAVGAPGSVPGDSGWLLVAGGVSWPWRDSGRYMQALSAAARKANHGIKIIQFGGAYRWHESPVPGQSAEAAPDLYAVEHHALLPYAEFSRLLTSQGHIGVELAEWNIERSCSQSFRSLEFLRHGLPLLCNRYLPIAGLVESFNAGWLVDGPDELESLLSSITAAPQDWARKSAGALRLVNEVLRPGRSVSPLLEWLKSPVRAPRLPAELRSHELPPVLGVPPFRKRLQRQFKLARQVALARIFGSKSAGKGVLFVTRGDLFPADHGAAVRTVETARALARSGLPVGVVTDHPLLWYEYSGDDFQVRRFPWWVRLLRLPGPLLKLLHHTKNLPHSNSFLYMPMTDSGFFWRILAAAKSIRPGILQAEFPAYALPCIRTRDILDCQVVLVEHNIEYARLQTQLGALSDAQYNNLKDIELHLCANSDAVVCVSDNDRQQLLDDGIRPALLHTISHGVNLAAYAVPALPGIRQKYAIADDEALLVYHGTFSYPPNRQAIRIFAETLLPGLERKGLRCHVLAVGKEPPASSPHERIHFTGSVVGVAPWLKAADLAVVPLAEGGGTRMKIVDCFAAGLAVISTSKGIEGIPVEPGHHALIIDDWDDMIDAIIRLWRQPDQRKDLAAAGARLAADMDWSAVAQRFRAVYSGLA